MVKPEKDVKGQIKKLLDELKAWHFMPVPTGYGKKGVPDHVACVPMKITQDMVGDTIGVFVGIEAKQLGKEMSAAQVIQADGIQDASGVFFCVQGTEEEGGTFSSFKSAMYIIFDKLLH